MRIQWTGHMAAVVVISIVGIRPILAEDKPATAVVPFSSSQRTRDLIPEVRLSIVKLQQESFGSPLHPRVPKGIPDEGPLGDGLAVYSKQCVRCHGVGGDGAGVDSGELSPQPRDFRRGQFKWKSTAVQHRVTRHDLRETVRLGLPGTAMPAFADLSDRETNAVVDYVNWLSMAGEFEIRLADDFVEFNQVRVTDQIKRGAKRAEIIDAATTRIKDELPELATEVIEFIAMIRKSAELESSIVRPKTKPTPTSDASIQRGSVLFRGVMAKCNTCHGEAGKGDGVATRDRWKRPGYDEYYPVSGLHDMWGNLAPPRDLTTDRFRGGDGPEDLFRRISAGISGTPMPGYASRFTEPEIWDLVNYVNSLRAEPRTAPSIRRSPPIGTVVD